MVESKFQSQLVKEIKKTLPGCYVFKTDPSQVQGFPDLLILYKKKWAALEVKASATANHRPNQDHHVKACNEMSFGSFIYPENKEEVINGMVRFLKGLPRRKSCPLLTEQSSLE